MTQQKKSILGAALTTRLLIQSDDEKRYRSMHEIFASIPDKDAAALAGELIENLLQAFDHVLGTHPDREGIRAAYRNQLIGLDFALITQGLSEGTTK